MKSSPAIDNFWKMDLYLAEIHISPSTRSEILSIERYGLMQFTDQTQRAPGTGRVQTLCHNIQTRFDMLNDLRLVARKC